MKKIICACVLAFSCLFCSVIGLTYTKTTTANASTQMGNVIIYYYNPQDLTKNPTITVYKGIHSDTANRVKMTGTTGTEDGKPYFTADLEDGLYCAVVKHGSNYIAKYFYVEGDPVVVDVPYVPTKANNWSETASIIQSDKFLEKIGTDGLVGFKPFDTPTFTNHADEQQAFMNNNELVAYVNNLDKSSTNLKVYYPFKNSKMGNSTPVLVFAKNADSFSDNIREAGEQVQKLNKEVLMTTGGVHGNEPAGTEGNLVFAKELCGEYGNQVLDFFGAIVLMPSVAVDNSQRFTRTTLEGINPNRDLMHAELESTKNQIYVYNSFRPTVCIDCHEDYSKYNINKTTLITDSDQLNDVAIRYADIANASFYEKNGYIFQTKDSIQSTVVMNAIEELKTKGLRATIYNYTGNTPANSKEYAAVEGSLSILIEVRRINSGKSHYERAVFGMKEALKTLTGEIMSYNGVIAEKVKAGRESLKNITKFDKNNLFALEVSSSNFSYTVINPTLHASGEWANQNGTRTVNVNNKITKSRPMATAYVVDANNPNIYRILRLLDIHEISYTKIKEGSTMLLKKYSGGYINATLGTETEVTFEKGAYVITLNSEKAYLIASLFEPDSVKVTASSAEEDKNSSLSMLGYITDENPVYRSEVDDVHLLVQKLDVNAPKKGGCGSSLIITNALLSVVLLAGATVIFKKKD